MTCTIPLNYESATPKRLLTPLRITYAVAILAGGSTLFFGMAAGLFIIPAAIIIGVAAVLSARRLGILHALGANAAAALSVGISMFISQMRDERSATTAFGEAAYLTAAMLAMFGVLGLFGGGLTIGIGWIVRKLVARARSKSSSNPATSV